MINGNYWNAFVDAVKDKVWNKAAKYILEVIGASSKATNIAIKAAEIAIAAYNCRGEW